MSFFCIPSDDRVQVQWQIFRVGRLEPEILSRPGFGFQTPSLQISPSGRTVTLTNAIASDAGVYRCTVADDTGLLVSPFDVNVTVLRSKLFCLIGVSFFFANCYLMYSLLIQDVRFHMLLELLGG